MQRTPMDLRALRWFEGHLGKFAGPMVLIVGCVAAVFLLIIPLSLALYPIGEGVWQAIHTWAEGVGAQIGGEQ